MPSYDFLKHIASMIKYKLKHIQEVSSTNTHLQGLIRQSKAEEGTVILADYQISGKGRGSSTWVSEAEKNLTFSFLTEPALIASHHFSLAEFVSLALCDTINDYKIDAQIKWPNDIYVAHNKIAGILIENILVGNTISISVIGIGMNVNQEIFPDDLPNPVSLKLLLGQLVNKEVLFKKLLYKLAIRYNELKSGLYDKLHKDYCEKLYCRSRTINYSKDGIVMKGVLVTIKESGEIVLKNDDGIEVSYLFDEIKLISF